MLRGCRITGVSVQLFQHQQYLLWNRNFPAGGAGFGRLDDHLRVTISAGNSADRPVNFQRSEFQVEIAPL